MPYQNILVTEEDGVLEMTIHRPEVKNAINLGLLREMQLVLDEAEKNDAIRSIILKGENGVFCSGMDFKEVSQVKEFNPEDERQFASAYMGILKRFASISKIIISICDGKVLAGGVGFAAASDIVIATPKSEFGLSEMLWGLLPANVMPYLIRRVGFQSAYFMTLTTKNISAEKAEKIHLVDIVSEDPDKEFKLLNRRLGMLAPKTIQRMKAYFRKMWIVTDEMEQLAIETLTELKMDPLVQGNIKNFITSGKFPWETK